MYMSDSGGRVGGKIPKKVPLSHSLSASMHASPISNCYLMLQKHSGVCTAYLLIVPYQRTLSESIGMTSASEDIQYKQKLQPRENRPQKIQNVRNSIARCYCISM